MPEADLDIHGLQPVDPALYAEREEILERIEDVDPADISDADNLEISQNLLKINIAEANREFAVSGAGRLMDSPTLSINLQDEFILDGEGQLLPAYTQSLDMGSYGGSTAATVVAGQEE